MLDRELRREYLSPWKIPLPFDMSGRMTESSTWWKVGVARTGRCIAFSSPSPQFRHIASVNWPLLLLSFSFVHRAIEHASTPASRVSSSIGLGNSWGGFGTNFAKPPTIYRCIPIRFVDKTTLNSCVEWRMSHSPSPLISRRVQPTG